MAILQVESYLPDMMRFIDFLASEYNRGSLNSVMKMELYVRAFFTPDMMSRVETYVPGWRKMASYAQGATLVHVVTALTALLLSPDYERASAEQKALAKWFVLLHDVEKEAMHNKRDHTHGFRSAIVAGKVMARSGFVLNNRNKTAFDAWATLTQNAFKMNSDLNQPVQDNDKLPGILAGIDNLFGAKTPAALIVKTVLLHMSIDVLTDWPQAAPLTEAEIQQFIDPELLALLRIMMSVDNDAWHFFLPAIKARYRVETWAVFDRIEEHVAHPQKMPAVHRV